MLKEFINSKELKNFINNKLTDKNGNIHRSKLPNTPFYENNIEIYQKLFKYYKTSNIKECVALYKFKLNEIPKCKCGNKLKFQKINKPYLTYCTPKCTANYTIDKVKETKNNKTKEQKQQIIDKRVNTRKNHSKEQKQQTYNKFIKSINTPNKDGVTPKEISVSKVKKSKIKNGTVQSNKDIIKKSYNTKVMNNTLPSNEEIAEKTRKTNIKRYGVDNPFKSEDIKDKIKKTNLEKFGVEVPLQNKDVLHKLKQTNLEKYGVDVYTKSDDYKRNQSNVYYDKCKQQYKDNNIEILTSKEEFVNTREVKLKCECGNVWSNKVLHNGVISRCLKCNPKKWVTEKEIYDFVNNITGDFKANDRTLIYPLELDSLNNKIAIEYNGLMFHSYGKSDYSMFNNYKLENKNVHLNKTILCEDKNIQLFHIFENEWLNKKDIWKSVLENSLGDSKRIYARKCSIKEIKNTKLVNEFLDNNHLQGKCNSNIKIGLYYNNELVSIMTFSKSRYNKNIEYELIRFCNKKGLSVIGGASKLLKYFERNYNPKSIISYANRRWSNGNLYKKLGFEFKESTKPNYFYFNPNENVLYSRVKFQKHKLKNLLDNFDDNLTETENMYNNNYRKIYDCGNLTFIKQFT